MAVSYENVNPSLIANTTMQKRFYDGVHKQYCITANDGYVLHDNTLDQYEGGFTEDGEPIGELLLGYTTTTCTCAASYDFATNPREFYAVLASDVPVDQIYGGVDNDHEVM
jgi:hypothetical protein